MAVVAANRVVACSEAARAEGVECGLRRRQAESRCPGIVVVADDPARDARAFEPVVAAVEAFTPGVEIVRPGACAFATRGPSRYFGGDASLAAKVAEAVDRVLAGMAAGAPRCRVGVADGRLAAELAALSSRGEPVVVARGGSRAFLADFSVAAATGGDLDRADLLVRLGIRTLGDLAALPMPAVLARFGTEGAVSCRRARGLDERPLAARTPPPDLAVTAELDPPADRLETVAFLARSLAEQLHLALATRGLAATRVLVEAETEHGEWLARRWRHDGGLTPAALAERVRWQIDGWLAGRPGPDGGRDDDGGRTDLGALRAPGDRNPPKSGRSTVPISARTGRRAAPTGPGSSAVDRPGDSCSCGSRPTRWVPTTAASSGSGVATGPRPSGWPGPWPGCRGCSGPSRWSPPPSSADGARSSRPDLVPWGDARAPRPRAPRSPRARPPSPRGRDGSRRRRRPPSTPSPGRRRWSTAPAGRSRSRPGGGVGPARPPGGGGPAVGRGGGVGRPVAGRRALVGPRRPPPPGAQPGRHRRRHRLPAGCRSRPLGRRGDLRLTPDAGHPAARPISNW